MIICDIRRGVVGIVALLCLIQPSEGQAQRIREALDQVASKTGGTDEKGFSRLELTVDGVVREALVYVPSGAKTNSTSVVFVFHGHGGSSRNAIRSFGMHRHWPEAISVYMQGLNTPGRLTDPEGKKPGWQSGPGKEGDRDIKFFDMLFAQLKQDYRVDEKSVYVTGHSNGGQFSYLLWAMRDSQIAAVAPSGAVGTFFDILKPKPAMHIAGDKDPLVKFEWQKKMMETLRKLNGCEAEGQEWAPGCIIYPSKLDVPFVTFIYHGGHEFPSEAPPLIVKFFKEYHLRDVGNKGG